MPRCGLCRVCFEDGGDIIAPCNCKGSSKWIHRDCLNQWRGSGSNPKALTHCCQCQFEYRLVERDNVSQVRETSATTVAFAVFLAALMLFFVVFSAVALLVGSIVHALGQDVWIVEAVMKTPPTSWGWVLYLAGAFVPSSLLGAVFVLTFLRTFPGRFLEETTSFFQALRDQHCPSAADWWNMLGNACCIYWMVKGVAYASTLSRTDLGVVTFLCLVLAGGFVGQLLIIIAVTALSVVSYREYSKISLARALTNKFDVEDLAHPDDMGDVEEAPAPATPSHSQPDLQRALSEHMSKIYGDDVAAPVGAAPAAPEAAEDPSRLERIQSGLQRAVARGASGLLGAAPPAAPRGRSRSPPTYGSAGSSAV